MWRMRKSIRRRWMIGIVFCFIQCGVLIFGYGMIRYALLRKYTALLEEKDAVMKQAERTVYITRTCVKAGELFTEENTERKTLLSEQNPEGLETEVIGKIACADLPEGSIVAKALCCAQEVHGTERECVLRNIQNTEYFTDGAIVELRIRYDNGENYCVLKKKRIGKKEEEREICRFYLTEEEQLLLSAAQYDVQIYDGAELYMVGFREARIQSDACSEYLPPAQILMQLGKWDEAYNKSSEQKREQRVALEERLAEYVRKRKSGML